MKKILEWIFLVSVVASLVLLFTSCRSKDTTLKTASAINTEVNNNISDSTDIVSNTVKEQSQKESSKDTVTTNANENTSRVDYSVEYDTDKPIDLVTGKHPIKKETTSYINTNKVTDQKKLSESNKEQSIFEISSTRFKRILSDQSKSKLKYSEQSELEEKSHLNIFQRILIVAGLIALGIVGYKVYNAFISIKKGYR